MTGMNEWDARFDYYRDSRTHAEGADLDRLIEWCDPGPGVTALDVATGGGHVARRLREAACSVTSSDAAPGMRPDVVCTAEDLPFGDASFDVVVCRVAVHHFAAPLRGIVEMARVSRRLVVLEDTLYVDARVQEAEKLRDPTHAAHYTRDDFADMLVAAGLRVTREARFPKRHEMDDWLLATGCTGEAAARVRSLLAHVAEPGGAAWTDTKWVCRAEKG